MCPALHTSAPATATVFHLTPRPRSRLQQLIFRPGALSGSEVLFIMDELGDSARVPSFMLKFKPTQTYGPGGVIDMIMRKAACEYLGIALPPDEVFAELFREPRVDHELTWPVHTGSPS